MASTGECVFDTSNATDDGTLLKSLRALGAGWLVMASSFQRRQAWWYPNQEAAEAALPEKDAAYKGASGGPLGEHPVGAHVEPCVA